MLVDYHTHLERGPYTLDYLKRFLDVGRERGVEEVCFTEHGHLFHESWHFLNNDWPKSLERRHMGDFLALIAQAKRAGLPVKLGLEMDYVPQMQEQIRQYLCGLPLDFVLGSVHWIDSFGFDNPDWIEQWDKHDVDELYHRYFALVRQAIASRCFDALAHPDVIKIFGHRPTFDLTEEYLRTAHYLKQTGVCLEVSTAGWRKPVNELYPHEDFLRICLNAGVDVTLASDAHEPEHVGYAYPRLVGILREFGVSHIATFTNRRKYLVAL